MSTKHGPPASFPNPSYSGVAGIPEISREHVPERITSGRSVLKSRQDAPCLVPNTMHYLNGRGISDRFGSSLGVSGLVGLGKENNPLTPNFAKKCRSDPGREKSCSKPVLGGGNDIRKPVLGGNSVTLTLAARPLERDRCSPVIPNELSLFNRVSPMRALPCPRFRSLSPPSKLGEQESRMTHSASAVELREAETPQPRTIEVLDIKASVDSILRQIQDVLVTGDVTHPTTWGLLRREVDTCFHSIEDKLQCINREMDYTQSLPATRTIEKSTIGQMLEEDRQNLDEMKSALTGFVSAITALETAGKSTRTPVHTRTSAVTIQGVPRCDEFSQRARELFQSPFYSSQDSSKCNIAVPLPFAKDQHDVLQGCVSRAWSKTQGESIPRPLYVRDPVLTSKNLGKPLPDFDAQKVEDHFILHLEGKKRGQDGFDSTERDQICAELVHRFESTQRDLDDFKSRGCDTHKCTRSGLSSFLEEMRTYEGPSRTFLDMLPREIAPNTPNKMTVVEDRATMLAPMAKARNKGRPMNFPLQDPSDISSLPASPRSKFPLGNASPLRNAPSSISSPHKTITPKSRIREAPYGLPSTAEKCSTHCSPLKNAPPSVNSARDCFLRPRDDSPVKTICPSLMSTGSNSPVRSTEGCLLHSASPIRNSARNFPATDIPSRSRSRSPQRIDVPLKSCLRPSWRSPGRDMGPVAAVDYADFQPDPPYRIPSMPHYHPGNPSDTDRLSTSRFKREENDRDKIVSRFKSEESARGGVSRLSVDEPSRVYTSTLNKEEISMNPPSLESVPTAPSSARFSRHVTFAGQSEVQSPDIQSKSSKLSPEQVKSPISSWTPSTQAPAERHCSTGQIPLCSPRTLADAPTAASERQQGESRLRLNTPRFDAPSASERQQGGSRLRLNTPRFDAPTASERGQGGSRLRLNTPRFDAPTIMTASERQRSRSQSPGFCHKYFADAPDCKASERVLSRSQSPGFSLKSFADAPSSSTSSPRFPCRTQGGLSRDALHLESEPTIPSSARVTEATRPGVAETPRKDPASSANFISPIAPHLRRLEEKLRNFVTSRVNPIVDAPPNASTISPQKLLDVRHQVEEKLRNFVTTKVNPILEALDREDKLAVGGNLKDSDTRKWLAQTYDQLAVGGNRKDSDTRKWLAQTQDRLAVGGNRKASNLHKCQCGRQYGRKPSSDMREALRGRSRERSDSSARR